MPVQDQFAVLLQGDGLLADLLARVLVEHGLRPVHAGEPHDIVVVLDGRPPQASPAPVLVVVDGSAPARDGAVLLGGATSIVSTEQGLGAAAAAVRLTAEGSCVLPPGLSSAVLTSWWARTEDTPAGVDVVLTPRERDVLRGLADGLSGKETARRLGIGLKTVEVHKSRLYSKLGVRSATQALAAAHLAGLLRQSPSGPPAPGTDGPGPDSVRGTG